jgi:hypothetical protein
MMIQLFHAAKAFLTTKQNKSGMYHLLSNVSPSYSILRDSKDLTLPYRTMIFSKRVGVWTGKCGLEGECFLTVWLILLEAVLLSVQLKENLVKTKSHLKVKWHLEQKLTWFFLTRYSLPDSIYKAMNVPGKCVTDTPIFSVCKLLPFNAFQEK